MAGATTPVGHTGVGLEVGSIDNAKEWVSGSAELAAVWL